MTKENSVNRRGMLSPILHLGILTLLLLSNKLLNWDTVDVSSLFCTKNYSMAFIKNYSGLFSALGKSVK